MNEKETKTKNRLLDNNSRQEKGENHGQEEEKTTPITGPESGLTSEHQESTPSTREKIAFLKQTLPPPRHRHDWFFSRKVGPRVFLSRCTGCSKQRKTHQVNAGLRIVEITGEKSRRIRVNG